MPAQIDMNTARIGFAKPAGQVALSQFRSPIDPCMPATGQIAMSQLLCKPSAIVLHHVLAGTGKVTVQYTRGFAYHPPRYDVYEDGVKVAANIATTVLSYVRVVPPKYSAETSVLSVAKYVSIGHVLTYGVAKAAGHNQRWVWNGVQVYSVPVSVSQTPRIGDYIYYRDIQHDSFSGVYYYGIKRRVYSKTHLKRTYFIRAHNAEGYTDSAHVAQFSN